MPQNDVLKRYLDAGVAFTQMTRSQAKSIVKDLVKAGELQQKQSRKQVDELVERSRTNTEQLMQMVRNEITTQLSSLGLATRDDIARLEAKIDAARDGRPTPELVVASPPTAAAEVAAAAAASTPTPTASVRKSPAKKAPAKKAPAKKA